MQCTFVHNELLEEWIENGRDKREKNNAEIEKTDQGDRLFLKFQMRHERNT